MIPASARREQTQNGGCDASTPVRVPARPAALLRRKIDWRTRDHRFEGGARIQMMQLSAGDSFHAAVARVSASVRRFVADIGQSDNLICQKWPISPITFANLANIYGVFDSFFNRVKMKIDGMAGKGAGATASAGSSAHLMGKGCNNPVDGGSSGSGRMPSGEGRTNQELKTPAHPLQPVAFNIPVRKRTEGGIL